MIIINIALHYISKEIFLQELFGETDFLMYLRTANLLYSISGKVRSSIG